MNQLRRRYLAAVAIACVIVAGCERHAPESNGAAGQVLEGTISDKMIATDQVRSDPPLAPYSATASAAKAEKAKKKAAVDDAKKAVPTAEVSPPAIDAPVPKPVASDPAG